MSWTVNCYLAVYEVSCCYGTKSSLPSATEDYHSQTGMQEFNLTSTRLHILYILYILKTVLQFKTYHLYGHPCWYILRCHHVLCVGHSGTPYEHHFDPYTDTLDQNLVGKHNSQYPYDTPAANLSLLCLHGCSHDYGCILMYPAVENKTALNTRYIFL